MSTSEWVVGLVTVATLILVIVGGEWVAGRSLSTRFDRLVEELHAIAEMTVDGLKRSRADDIAQLESNVMARFDMQHSDTSRALDRLEAAIAEVRASVQALTPGHRGPGSPTSPVE